MELKINQKVCFEKKLYNKLQYYHLFMGTIVAFNEQEEVFIKIDSWFDTDILDIRDNCIDEELSIAKIPISRLVEENNKIVYKVRQKK